MPLNVLHLRASTGFGGADSILLSICENLDPQRFNVSILATFPDRFEKSFLTSAAKRLGIPCNTLRYSHRFSLKSIGHFLKYVKNQRIDIIHSHGYRENVMASSAIYLKNIATVSTIHGWTAGSLRKQIDLWALRATHRILAVSPTVQKELLSAGIPVKKVVLLPNSVDTNQYQKMLPKKALKEKFDIRAEQFVVGTVARLSPEKGIDYLIRAVQFVVKQFPTVKFLIVGDGPERKSLENLARNLGLNQVIHFAGYQEDMKSIYALINLYVSSSLQEESPRSILEAAACEKAIVATDVGGVSQIIKDSETGTLVPAGQPHRLAEEIINLLQNKHLCSQYGKRARNYIRLNFSLKESIRNLESVYEKVFSEVTGREIVPSVSNYSIDSTQNHIIR